MTRPAKKHPPFASFKFKSNLNQMFKSLYSNHLLEETVDQVLTVAEVSPLGEVVGLLAPAAAGVVQLEVPDEVVGHFEVGADGVDFVDQVFDADDPEFAQSLLDDFIGQSTTTALQLAVTALVDQLADGLEVGVSPGDVGVCDTQHAEGGLVQLDERRVVDLAEAEELKDLADAGVQTVNTPQPHDDGELGFRWDVEVAVFPGISAQSDLVGLRLAVFLDVLFGALENDASLRLLLFLLKKSSLDLFGPQIGASFPLFQEGFWNCRKFCWFGIHFKLFKITQI